MGVWEDLGPLPTRLALIVIEEFYEGNGLACQTDRPTTFRTGIGHSQPDEIIDEEVRYDVLSVLVIRLWIEIDCGETEC